MCRRDAGRNRRSGWLFVIKQPALDQCLRTRHWLRQASPGGRVLAKCQLPVEYLVHLCVERVGKIRADKIFGGLRRRARIEEVELGGKFVMNQRRAFTQQEIEFADGIVRRCAHLQAIGNQVSGPAKMKCHESLGIPSQARDACHAEKSVQRRGIAIERRQPGAGSAVVHGKRGDPAPPLRRLCVEQIGRIE